MLRPPPAIAAQPPDDDPLAMLERLHAGERPDYCLYLRPITGAPAAKKDLLSVDVEELLLKAFDPLPMLVVDEVGKDGSDAGLPDESFLMLANCARVLLLVPTAEPRFGRRLRLLKEQGPLDRCIFLMPEQGTLGSADWPALWPGACAAAAEAGIELSGYTCGGWLFRLGPDAKACTFRPIVNPTVEKIAKALESICAQM
ncbi:MAG TPA: hypothetical protein VFC78_16145 [Tepidisphaeraceae bacterium]|nr:hypothetical protein [Tepidisphaeraceae bacterium]